MTIKSLIYKFLLYNNMRSSNLKLDVERASPRKKAQSETTLGNHLSKKMEAEAK